MKRIRVSRHAERDLDRIWHHIAADASILSSDFCLLTSVF
jgi:plasmid stabilization system protein ParE